jgi:putative N6-adenine-specific DNA methylase
LKETLAAALVQLSYWNNTRLLVDPFCGSGTIPIEAALIGLNIAPGIDREFDFQSWHQISNEWWDEAVEEAGNVKRTTLDYRIQGYDVDPDVLRIARNNAEQAGVAEWIDFHARDIAEFKTSKKYGCIITNPPYGERLGEEREAEAHCKTMRKVFSGLDTWSIYVLTACENFERLYGTKATRRRKLYNGRIKTTYYQYAGARPPKKPVENMGE